MGITDRYQSITHLPAKLPLFPLLGCVLLPRCALQLNVFEPRYLDMIDDVLRGDRVLGIIQPLAAQEESPKAKNHPLRHVGSAGRLTSYTETEDGRLMITLTGICRFAMLGEEKTEKPYRIGEPDFSPFKADLIRGAGEQDVDWANFLRTLRTYLDARQLSADWEAVQKSRSELLVNTLAMIGPYGAEEKQALLECPDLKKRAEVLAALAEMELASPGFGSGSSLH